MEIVDNTPTDREAMLGPQRVIDSNAMIRCIGSGVPGDWWEHGHEILPGTEQQMFPKWTRLDRRVESTYSRHRCHRCASTRRYFKRSTDATAKAVKAHRAHAHRMVDKGLAPDVETAVAIMNNAGPDSGLTVAWLAQTALAAINKPCPGRCFTAEIINGKPVCQDHIITEWADLTLDWREPDQPLSRENVGWLCMTCNQQKHNKSWAWFMSRQHAVRRNFLHAELTPYQDTLFDFDF